jgi:hypothetical protein
MEMTMDAMVERLPRTGRLQIEINVQADVNYSTHAARRKVSRFVADEISYLMRGGEPTLAIAERICWRVPVILTLPPQGPVGTVGTIDVDVETGQLYITPELIAEITQHAEYLAARHPSASGSSAPQADQSF